jgi:1-acyl-sn-glycerol-3-phosphate acyltransferase
MADAEIIQLGSRGRPGRGSRSAPSAAARGLAAERSAAAGPENRRTPRPRVVPDAPEPEQAPDAPAEPTPDLASTPGSAGAPGSAAPTSVVQHLLSLVASLGEEVAGSLGADWNASVASALAFARSRISGDYTVDEFGFDAEWTEKVFLPLLRPLVQSWFRVEVRGIENVPSTGPALLVSNHAGTMPLDGMVLQTIVYDEIARHVRLLGADLIFKTPYSHDLARRTGTTLASQEDAERLLAGDQLVAVFPEGFKGLGKPYVDRYKLQRFGRGGFVSAAVRASVPIIPVSIVGSEEIYPLIASAPGLARAMGVPYFPVTPLFPWLGVLGLIPLPSKWIIEFGEAIATDELSPGAADDPMVVFNVTDQVRETIQHTLYALLMQRRSAFS